jgi:hypothetical protein
MSVRTGDKMMQFELHSVQNVIFFVKKLENDSFSFNLISQQIKRGNMRFI